MASDSQNHREIARSLDINRQMARLWRNRWLETDGKDLSILQRLQYQERVAPPVKFSMEQVIELFALFVFATRRLRQANKSLDISEHWQMKS
jgi:putative transposase